MDLEMPHSTTEVNVKSSIKWNDKFYHEFIVYLPVVLLITLIGLIFTTYYFEYLHVLLTSSSYSLSSFPLALTTDIKSASNKGWSLFIVSTVFLILLLISLFRTVFMDPGYFEDPTKLELNLITKNSRGKGKSKQTIREVKEDLTSLLKDNPIEVKEENKNMFFSQFSSIINELPLTFNEYSMLYQNVEQYLGTRRQMSVLQIDKTQKIEQLKKELEKKPEPKEHINPLTFTDVYDNFLGIDLLKLPLCNTCYRWKVERSHHCRQCGNKNYKFFCLIHFYGTLNSIIVAATMWEPMYNSYADLNRSVFEASFIIYVYICNLGLLCFLFWLFAFNWTLIFTGQTVIEQSERERFPSSKPDNFYDLGSYKNFTTVFGKNPLVWFIPFFPNYEGQGIVYETNLHPKR